MEYRLPLERFETLVDEALDSIPNELYSVIENVAVTVEDWPNYRQLNAVKVGPGRLLLGLYEGIPITGRHNYGLVAPDKITIFRGPILQVCPHNEDAVRQQVRRTVIHEIAHHFGISDERLVELGAY